MNPNTASYLLGMHGDPWEIERSRLKGYLETLIVSDMSPEEITQRTGPRSATKRGAIAVLPLTGPITKRSSLFTAFFGGSSTDKFGEVFDSLIANDEIGAIVLDVDSPGGTADGTMELADKIYQARGTKPIVAVANSWMASAAYKISSAADTVVSIPSGQVGSIGTLSMHVDYSGLEEQMGVKTTLIYAGRYKVEFNPFEPLGDEARAEMQRVVDAYYGEFVKSVARNRGVSTAIVKRDFGQGRMMLPQEAKAAGMIDRIGTLESEIERLGGRLAERDAVRLEAEARDLEVSLLAAYHGGIEATVPGNPPGGDGEGVDGTWRKLRLEDFTDTAWEELSDGERGRIAKYFAWYSDLSTFGNLKLGHHFPPGHESAGKPSARGVSAALARLNQTQGVGDERGRVEAHLRAHQG